MGKIHSVPGASVERVILEQRPGNGLAPCWVCWSLGGIGSILGAVVWYTRPSRGEQDHQR
ncbi:hypothetical protein LN650_11350 [Klebsiella pneumoniae subsp. pneumoniae]|nr:hypothetical protein [Klebsiella pneumoniae subsp. pneumoniae]